jgi:hypothetical protein
MNVDEAILHFGPNPIASVAKDFDVAPLHECAQVHANSAVNGDPALGHCAPNPTDFV